MITIPTFLPYIRLNKVLLLLGVVAASLSGIVLQNAGLLPLDLVTFFFFSFVLFLLALYRLGWTFLLFIGVLPLETINVAPAVFGGIMLRPYQWLTVLLLLAVGVRFILKRLPFAMFRPRLFDILPVCIALGGFIALLGAPLPEVALKQAVVVTSFVGIYFLGRIFFRTFHDVRQALPFFLVSSLVVFGYALWQNIMFLNGKQSFQVMVGRPNATFSEADWLGLFVIFAVGVGLAMLAQFFRLFAEKNIGSSKLPPQNILPILLSSLYLMSAFVILVLSVARSAWLGALVLVGVFFVGIFLLRGVAEMRRLWKRGVFFGVTVGVAFFLAVILVTTFHLSPFQFFNRIQSTGTGFQKITVSCIEETLLPEKIAAVDELTTLGCRHIDLEAIVQERNAGRFIGEVSRPDPNVSIRRHIYGQVWDMIKEHPLSGIGWGSAALFLGADERGAGLNASNVFLEVWLGSGIIGLMAFVMLWCLLVFAAFRWYRETNEPASRALTLFLLVTLFGITVFNLFNSGILLGCFFVFLSVGALALEREETKWRTKENTL